MVDVIGRAISYVLVILVVYICKEKGLFPQNSAKVLSSLMLTLTLPCSIIMNLNNQSIQVHFIFLIGLGILYNIVSLCIGYCLGRKDKREVMTMINVSGYNIGCFAMPFISGLLDSSSILVASIFDIGNSIMCLGTNYGIGSALLHHGKGSHFSIALSKVIRSTPIWTYSIMLVLSFLSISIPSFILPFFETVGKANPFIAMSVIGLSLHITFHKEYLYRILKCVSLRLWISMGLAIFSYLFISPVEIRNVIVLLCFAPIGAAAVIFTDQLGLDSEEAACINSLYVLISIVIMTLFILLM